MRFTIIHAADLHLDSPLVGLERYEGAPVNELRAATRRALENLVQLCLSEDAKLLLLSGDLYDGDWKDYATGLFFAAQMARLREVGTRVVWIRGNHDAQSKLTKNLSLGEHCVELGVKKPESCLLESLQVAVHGQGFATPAVSEDLTERYPAPIAGALNIGLLHTALGGRRGHASYAPCDVRALEARGYDYWALGHVHQREVVQQPEGGGGPWVVFPGNLQARHVRESGAKGATLISVCDGAIERVEHRALDVVRFEQLTVDVSRASTLSDVGELTRLALADGLERADGRLLCARVHLVGRSPSHAELARDSERAKNEIRRMAGELDNGDVWLEGVRFATELPHDLSQLAQRDDATGQLVRALSTSMRDTEPADEQSRRELLEELKSLNGMLPAEVSLRELGIDLDDEQCTRELFGEVSRSLLARVLGQP
ncbi:MAG: repair exonuclease family protein [Myxococcaceae bacterium]|nr:repair exonuclease family protein [Myxococcaceae bacterium]